MKKTIYFALCFLISFSLFGCGVDPKLDADSDKTVLEAPSHIRDLESSVRAFVPRDHKPDSLEVVISWDEQDEYTIEIMFFNVDFGQSKSGALEWAVKCFTNDLMEEMGVYHPRYNVATIYYETVPHEFISKDEPMAVITCDVANNSFFMKLFSSEYEFDGDLHELSNPVEYTPPIYEDFNSYASENGLGGTPLVIEGSLKEATDNNGAISYIVSTADGDWLIGLYYDDKPAKTQKALLLAEELFEEGASVVVYGIYQGFSNVAELPGISIVNEDYSHRFNRIELSDGSDIYWTDFYDAATSIR